MVWERYCRLPPSKRDCPLIHSNNDQLSRFAVKRWDDGCAIFDRDSGTTHILNGLNSLVFEYSCGLVHFDGALADLAKERFPEHTDLAENIAQAVDQLAALGLCLPTKNL